MNDVKARPIGIIGIGIMGLAYAQNLRKAGFEVAGFDVAETSSAKLKALGGQALESPRLVAEKCDIILVALASIPALHEAMLGDNGVIHAVRKEMILCEMGTLPLSAKEEVRAAMEPHGVHVLDCPVSGTGAQAARGDLSIYASGSESAVDTVRPVFDGLARETRFVGPFGVGIKVKYIANLLVTIHNLAAAEALLLAEKSGLDLQMVLDAVSAGAGNSRMLEIRGPMMVEGLYEPATMKMDVFMKDLRLILDHARDVRCPTPLMSASLPYYVSALAQGRDKEDTGALFAVLQEMSRTSQGEKH